MTLSSSHQSPSETTDTPTVTTAQLAAIRASIRPDRGWWQFDFQPWHYWTAVGSAAVCVAVLIAFIATHGGAR